MNDSPKRAVARLHEAAGGALDAAVVLGSGLATAVEERFSGKTIAYRKLEGAPVSKLAGHPGTATVGTWGGKRVVAFAGRAHLYQGYSPEDVTYFVRLAAAAGARVAVLTNAAGGLNQAYERGDLMLIADHLNMTGATAIAPRDPQPFLNMLDAYSPRLRRFAKQCTAGSALREGVYAGLRGPAYETLAEAAALRRLGADAVGMSTVLETMMARKLGLEVLGLSLITNAIGPAQDVSHEDVLAASKDAGARIAALIEAVLGAA
ncbi:MAG: purine-nucleoside phosphorylase [Candidatus Eremiobacteraeota bacterium]|nr:purine-nucleoside phosphorylase [Candidatus Eremiobacteraeota bacterium]